MANQSSAISEPIKIVDEDFLRVVHGPEVPVDHVIDTDVSSETVTLRLYEEHEESTAPVVWPSQVLAAFLMIPILPIIAALVAIVRLTSKGPGIYRQERVGLNGETFTLYKIRSMRIDAEAKTGAVWAKKKDPRVIWIGTFLRWSHLDELPQLFNVLRGEMTFIGPRPERPIFVEDLATKIPRYRERLNIHPGVTGLAQVTRPADASLDTVREKLTMELAYMRETGNHRFLDAKIIFATALKMMGFPLEQTKRLSGLAQIKPVKLPTIHQPAEEPQRIAA